MVNEWDVTNEELFDLFWQMYPRKVGKKLCQKIWASKINRDDVDAIYTGLRKLRESEQWKKEGGKYIPHPSTFLNQERWNDEVPEDSELNLKSPETEEEVYITMILNCFGIKTYCNSNQNLLQFYKTNERAINDIKTYCPNIQDAIVVIGRTQRYLEDKGFSWTIASVARNFPYEYQKYEREKYYKNKQARGPYRFAY